MAERASRASARRTVMTHRLRTPRRPMTLVIERTAVATERAEVARHSAPAARTRAARTAHETARAARIAQATARITRQTVARQRAAARAATRSVRHRARQIVRRARTVAPHRRTVIARRPPAARSRGGMTAVIAFARSQVGKRYVTGGQGGSGFDCSGLTMKAYEQAGIRLPHSSRAQAGRARTISRSQARAGDLVIGPGHVGIYMGNGMMIDAGNHRVGVVYRKLYSGLRVARL